MSRLSSYRCCDDLEDVYFPFPMGDIFRFHVTFRGSMFRHLIWKNKSILISLYFIFVNEIYDDLKVLSSAIG